MALRDFFRRLLGVKEKAGPAESFGQLFLTGADQFLPTGVLNQPYAQHSVVHAAVSAIATNISSVPLEFFPVSDAKHETPIKESLPGTLIAAHGGGQGLYGTQVVEATMIFLELTGNAFWLLDGFAKRAPYTGPLYPTTLEILSPRCIRPKYDLDGNIVAYEYRETKSVYNFPPEKIVHFKYFNPYDEFWGLGTLQAAIVEVSGDYKATIWNERFFENSAIPNGILSPKVGQILQPDAVDRLREQFENRHRGLPNRGRLGVTSAAFDYLDIGLSQKEMDFLEGRAFSREQILMIFKVPPIAAGILRDANYNVAIEQRSQLWHNNLLPKMAYLESVIRARLCADFGIPEAPYFKVETVRPLIEDQAKIHEMAYKLWQMGVDFKQINARLGLGYDTKNRPALEVGWLPFSLVNADEQAQRPIAEQPTGTPAAPPQQQGFKISLVKDTRQNPDATELARTILWKTLLTRVHTQENLFEKRVRDHMRDLQRQVIARLHRGKAEEPAHIVLDEVMFDLEDAKKDSTRRTTQMYTSAVEEGAKSFLEAANISIDFDLLTQPAKDFLLKKRMEIGDIIDTPLYDQVRGALVNGMNEGASVDRIAEMVLEVFDVNRSRARRIARTEIAQAFNFGRYAAMDAAGVEKIEWLSARDDRVRDSHEEVDGDVITLGDQFKNGLRYPSDPEGPAEEVVNCRCTSLPAEA